MSEWPQLSKPPVSVALFQLKFVRGGFDLKTVDAIDASLRSVLPNRMDNMTADIDLPSTPYPLGASLFSGMTRLSGYTYFSQDQLEKLSVSDGYITYSYEGPYHGWEHFQSGVMQVLDSLSPVLIRQVIARTSIRFINRFEMDEFDDPEVYFRTLISATADDVLPFPSVKYGFKITLHISDDTYSIVNQNLDRQPDKYVYLFDIDVLNRRNIIFDLREIAKVMNQLREVKNKVFFGNVTQKTLELCR